MTKDGAVAENLSIGEVENISSRTPEMDVGSEKHQSSRLQFSPEDLENPVRVYDRKEHFAGLYQYDKERGRYWPVKLFL